MYKSHTGISIIILVLALSLRVSYGQLALDNTWSIGKHNASSGTYIRTSLSGAYNVEDILFNSQVQFNIMNAQQRTMSGFLLRAAKASVFTNFPLNISTQYLLIPFSETLRESNFSLIANKKNKGFSYSLGLNFRTLTYTKKAADKYNVEERRYHENWGLMYKLGYTYTPLKYKWDAGLFFTNWDTFLINQDMNPFLRCKSQYHFSSSLRIFLEGNYIKSGVFNSSSNYFGYYVKTGILWHVN